MLYYKIKIVSLALNNKSLGTKSSRSTWHGIGVLALETENNTHMIRS